MTHEGYINMHHPRSISAARRMRIASLLLLGNRLLIPAVGGLLLLSLLTYDQHLINYGLVLAVVCIFLIVGQWIAACNTGCPLCRTPVLTSMNCMKHRKAKRFLGSYQLRVALGIILMKQFRCPYCNESTAMNVTEKLRGSRPRGVQSTRIPKFY